MGGSNENFLGVNAIRHSNIQGVGNNNNARRPLSTINSNIIRTEKNGACIKNPVIPVHRPITRKFAAQLAGKEQQQPTLEKIKQPEDNIIVDEEDVPIYVQYTEAMLEEIDRMDVEVEMEDIDLDEPIVDIDSCDNNNPLAVTEYVDDIYAYYRKTEKMSCVPPNYMTQQFDINERMRAILIDWLIEVHYKFELMDETLYLTVNLIDRFLSVKPIVRKKLQLVGVTAMLLACKYEEVSVPVIEDLILISDKAYCRKEILDMEKLMINTLQFNMSFPNPYVFMRRFLKAAQSDKRLEMVSFFIIELCLVEYVMLRFRPSLLAAAAIFTAECAITGRKRWSKTSERYTNYTQDELLECARLMVSFHRSSGTGKLKGVYNKYSTLKYGYAAKAEPAVFLKDDA